METAILYGSLFANLLLLLYTVVERVRTGTSATQKEIRETYRERADQLEDIVKDLKGQVEKLTTELAGFKAQNKLMTEIIQNRNPELERILSEISRFLEGLNEKVDRALNISSENKHFLEIAKKRHDEIDRQFSRDFPEQVEQHIQHNRKKNDGNNRINN